MALLHQMSVHKTIKYPVSSCICETGKCLFRLRRERWHTDTTNAVGFGVTTSAAAGRRQSARQEGTHTAECEEGGDKNE